MPLRFVDDGGNEGWIHEDLSVRYVGGIDVEGAIEEIVDDDMTVGEVMNALIVGLPSGRPISSIERDGLGRSGGDARSGASEDEAE